MAGIHGKNVELRVSTSETVLSGTTMTQGTGMNHAVAAGSRDWKWDRERTLIQFTSASATVYVNTQTRFINYAGGAIELGKWADATSVKAQAVSMELETVGNLVGDARSFTVSVASDTVDTTTIGDSWKNFADGLQGFEGSLEGLYIDNYWYRQAIATLSGVIPQRVLRFVPDPLKLTTYYQGTVIFPEWELSGGNESAIEHSVPFQGRGPLDHIDAGTAWFNLAEVF